MDDNDTHTKRKGGLTGNRLGGGNMEVDASIVNRQLAVTRLHDDLHGF